MTGSSRFQQGDGSSTLQQGSKRDRQLAEQINVLCMPEPIGRRTRFDRQIGSRVLPGYD